ncbi:MAG: 1-phosphofructokinase family hexose kinase [Parvularculaceae bacterium]
MPRIITITPNPTYDFAVDAPKIEPNRKLRCVNPESHPGGGGLNVARAATRLGADTLAIFTTGGLYGAALKGLVAEEHVPMHAIHVSGETRLAFHVRDASSGDEYRFNLPGSELSASERRAVLDAVAAEAQAGDIVVGSGSLPPMQGKGAQDTFWADAARAAKSKGARFVLDSISGLEAALGEGVFLLRHNEHEYQALSGGALKWPDEISAFAKSLVDKGAAERVVITHGGDGSVMASKAGAVFTPVFPVRAHSAVGAGDSFVAGLCVALMQDRRDEDALRYASACAAATRLSSGTSLFKKEDVERLYNSKN